MSSRAINALVAAVIGLHVVIAAGIFIGFTPSRKVDALLLRCQLRGGEEIARAELGTNGGHADFECFKDGKLIDSYRLIVE